MSTPRPRSARLLTAFSPKLGRTVRAYDYAAFEQWVRLEVNPSILTFCEQPCCAGAGDDGRLIEFWAARPGQEEMLVVERGQGSAKLPKSVQNVPLRQIPAAEHAAAAVWVANCLRMIPLMNATRGTAPKNVIKSVLSLVRRPLALSLVEHELSVGDPAVVRGTIFELLRTGQLMAPSLSPKAGTEIVLTRGSELKLVFPQPGAMPEHFSDLDFRHFFLQSMDVPERKRNTQATIEYCRQQPQRRLSIQTHKVVGIA